jgi:hypothetical protein
MLIKSSIEHTKGNRRSDGGEEKRSDQADLPLGMPVHNSPVVQVGDPQFPWLLLAWRALCGAIPTSVPLCLRFWWNGGRLGPALQH